MKIRMTNWTLVAALALCTTAAFAQDQKQDTSPIDPNAPLQPLDTNPTPSGGNANRPPVGAVRGVEMPFDTQSYDPSQVTPDMNTLAGAEPISLGSLQHTRNTFDPTITVSQIGQTTPGKGGKTVLTGISMASGSLIFNRNWSTYHFSTVYSGGETFNLGYNAASTFFGQISPHYQYHDLTVTQEAAWARWHILLRDDFTATPGAAFTGQGMGGPGLTSQFSSMLGTSLNSFGQQFQPAETINTGQVMRYRNSILGQAEYSFSRRSAFTFSGSYGLLDFASTGYFNSTMVDGQAGYDYLLDPSDSIAILGSYGRINFTGTGISSTGTTTIASGNSVQDYVGALAFGRKITGRLAFQAAAGPQEIQFTGAGGAGNFHILFASVNSALTYERRRSGLAFNYGRGLTGGSGVFLGATSNTFSGSAHHQFSRSLTGGINAGYAMNESLSQAGVATAKFDNWFVGANLGRRVGQHVQVDFNYGATEQNNPTTCLVAGCGGTGLQQTIGLSINWHLRPAG